MSSPKIRLDDVRDAPFITNGVFQHNATFVFPSPQSISGKVLADMLCGDHVSVESMHRHYGAAIGSYFVRELRRSGWPVQRSEVSFSDPRDGVTVILTLYSLPPTAIVAAGDRCLVFLEQVREAGQAMQAKGGA